MTNDQLLDAIGTMLAEQNGKLDHIVATVGGLNEQQQGIREQLDNISQRLGRIDDEHVAQVEEIERRLKRLEARAA